MIQTGDLQLGVKCTVNITEKHWLLTDWAALIYKLLQETLSTSCAKLDVPSLTYKSKRNITSVIP